MTIQIPEKVNYIIDVLKEHGFEAYAVGGCVRDMLLQRDPEDWDITTSATPLEVKKLFRRTVDTGIQHGTVTVLLDKDQYEVTTYRLDGEYEDNRHPKEVSFTSSLMEDLKRRDFTINAMAYNEKEGFVDLFGGINDLNNGLIRCVGSATERFEEDALRILRAIRFSAQLDFAIEEETMNALKKKVELLKNISAERIRVEFTKLLISDHPEKINIAYEAGITRVVMPEFDVMMTTEQNNIHHIYNVGKHTIKAIEAIAGKLEENKFTVKDRTILRWTMLLHDIEKPSTLSVGKDGQSHFYGHQEKGAITAMKILKRLKFDNDTLDGVVHLIRWHDYRFVLTPVGMRKAVSKIGKEYMDLLFEVNRADTMAKNPMLNDEKFNKIKEAKRLYEEILKKGECVNLKDLNINGKDLIKQGFEPGRELGMILKILLSKVIEKHQLNDKDILLKLAIDLMDKNNEEN